MIINVKREYRYVAQAAGLAKTRFGNYSRGAGRGILAPASGVL
jgi:hypothetical protein